MAILDNLSSGDLVGVTLDHSDRSYPNWPWLTSSDSADGVSSWPFYQSDGATASVYAVASKMVGPYLEFPSLGDSVVLQAFVHVGTPGNLTQTIIDPWKVQLDIVLETPYLLEVRATYGGVPGIVAGYYARGNFTSGEDLELLSDANAVLAQTYGINGWWWSDTQGFTGTPSVTPDFWTGFRITRETP